MSKNWKSAKKDSVGKLPAMMPLAKIYDGLINDITKRQGTPELPTGLPELDRLLWGLHRKQLMIIAARPSEGKTTLGLQIAWNLTDAGKTVFFISLEMSKEQLLERLLCNTMSIRNTDLRSGQITPDMDARIETFGKMIREHKPRLLLTDDIGYDWRDIKRTIETLEPKPDVIVLDYLQLCSMGEYRSKVDAISEYVRAMKQLSIEHNIAMVCLSQINRGVKDRKDRRPLMDEVKGSGTIEEHADTVALLYWPIRNEDVMDPSLYEVDIAKQRHGATQMVELKFEPQHYRITGRH